MSDGAYIRQLGAAHRHQVAVHYHNRGEAGGRRIAKRYIEETLAEVCEAEGREAAYGLVMAVADRLVAGRMLETGNLLPGVIEPAATVEEEFLPGPRAAAARIASAMSIEIADGVDLMLVGTSEGAAVPLVEGWARAHRARRLAEMPGRKGQIRRVLHAVKPPAFGLGLVLGFLWATWLAR